MVEDLEEDDEAEDAVGGGADDGGHGAELGGAVEVADLTVGARRRRLTKKRTRRWRMKTMRRMARNFGSLF